MRRKRCSFTTAAAPVLLYGGADDAGLGPSTSGRIHSASSGGAGSGSGAGTHSSCPAAATHCRTGEAGAAASSWSWALQAASNAPVADWAARQGSSGRGWRGRRQQQGGPGADGGGGSEGFSRAMLLASLSTSAVAASGASGSWLRGGGGGAVSGGGAGAGAGAALRHGFHLPQLSIMRLPGPPSFAADQAQAEELLDYHTAKHGGFPRPCPRCQSAEFMLRREGGADGDAASPGVVEWSSRPLCCETCGSWVHLGCAGVGLVEQVPPQPWFHCRACRETFLRMEGAAQRNPHPSSASPTHSLYLLTPADLAVSQGGAGPARSRGPAPAVLPLLAQGFNPEAIQGFGQPAREYDGGKYSAVLVHRGQPVAAATFNVFGSEAQLCMLATAAQHRLKGNGSALVADLEAALAALGVSRLLVQARGVALPLWVSRLGYSLVDPREARELHRRLPIAYYDCAVLEKQLQ